MRMSDWSSDVCSSDLRHVVEHERVAERDRHAVAADHAVAPIRRAERSTSTKNGAPKKAVTTPMGISAGEEMVRARRSARHRKAPPKREDRKSTRLNSSH